MSKAVTVQMLADEAGVDAEEALLALWDAGIERPTSLAAKLFDREVKTARDALGLAGARDLDKRAYWKQELQLDDDDFDALLQTLSIPTDRVKRTLPKGAVRKLRAHARTLAPVRREPGEPKLAPKVLPNAPSPLEQPLPWRNVGRERNDMRYLTQDEVLEIYYSIAMEFREQEDPIFPAGVRDENLLGSAVSRPHTSHTGVLKYPTVEMGAAALLHGLVMDHPFHNGNKRTGLVAMLAFLDENGLVLTCDEKELFRFVLRLARHGLTTIQGSERTDQEVLKCAEWLVANDRAIEKSERPLQWRQLRKALIPHGVAFDFRGSDNCMMLSRRVVRPARFFGSETTVELHVQATFKGEGHEVDRHSIANIRRALELDDEHGVDSRAFYADAGLAVDAWINRYRQTLKRLAKM